VLEVINIVLQDMNGKFAVASNNEYVVLYDQCLCVLNRDGILLSTRKDLVGTDKIAFLSDDRLLVCGGKKSAYRLIDLKTMQDIWVIPPIKGAELYKRKVELSPDQKTAYDCYSRRLKYHLVKINLQTAKIEDYVLKESFGATRDFICDSFGDVFFLNCIYNETSIERFSINAMQKQMFDVGNGKLRTQWTPKWNHKNQRIAKFIFQDSDHILTNDIHVFDRKTGEIYYLLENSTDCGNYHNDEPIAFWMDVSGTYAILEFSSHNLIIDWKARKMVARYAGAYAKGCLVGDKYWISAEDGVRIVPFPLIENIPPEKPVYWCKFDY